MLFSVKSVALAVPMDTAFDYISNATNLPKWTNAFATVNIDETAVLATPGGEVPIKLHVNLDREKGVVDWRMTFPDGVVGNAYSRVVPLSDSSCAYSFVLTPPPVALEQLEGALAEQENVLVKELQSLKKILET